MLERKVIFCGYYGHLNTGDDAFCAICSWGAHKHWGTRDIRFLCRQTPKLPAPGRPALLSRSYFRGQNLIETAFQFAKGPAVVFGGGSLFERAVAWPSIGKIVDVVRRTGRIKVGAIGVSLGPYRSTEARRSIEKFLRRFSFLTLRDRRSFDDACSMDLPFEPVECSDLAFLLPRIYDNPDEQVPLKERKPIIGVSVRHYERHFGMSLENEERREKLLLETLRKTANVVDITVRLFTFNAHPRKGDVEVMKYFAESVGEFASTEVVPYSNDPELMWQKVSQCDGFLAVRLHAGIFAAAARVPLLMVEYHKKCSDFLDDLGWPAQRRIGDFEVSSDRASKILIELLSAKQDYSQTNLDSLIDRAELNFTGMFKGALDTNCLQPYNRLFHQ